MTRPAARLSFAALAVAAFFAAAVPAQAQGTEEQQEACTPDAVKLCQNTIPDIPKTEACMKAHYAQLSPRCQRAFNEVTDGPSSKPHPDVARRADTAPATGPRADSQAPAIAAAPADTPVSGYGAQIRSYCRQGLIDPFTCRNTLSLLHDEE